MAPATPILTHESVAEFWRRRFRRQKHVNAGVRSLLRKYGSATTSRGVATDLLLTLMGNLITSEACYYSMSGDERNLIPTVALGETELSSMPPIDAHDLFATTAHEGTSPRLMNSLPRAATDEPSFSAVKERFKVIAPLHHEDRLLGIVFLGAKVSGASFTDNDLELLEALCAVTAAVLSHMESQRLTGASEQQATRLLARCQELAGGVADHLERSLTAIDQLVAIEANDEHNKSLAAGVSENVASMRYLLSSLRVLANDPASIEDHSGERYDIIAALQEAVFSFDTNIASRSYTLNLRHDIQSTKDATPVDRTTVVEAARATLRAAIEQRADVGQLSVYIDRAEGLPAGIGTGSTGNVSNDRDDNPPARPMLRVRIAAQDSSTASGSKQRGMKILAGNLEAFQTLREPAPSQQLIVEQGGAIVSRRDAGLAVWLIYLPLSSV